MYIHIYHMYVNMYEYLQSPWVDNEGNWGGRMKTVATMKGSCILQISRRRLGKTGKVVDT